MASLSSYYKLYEQANATVNGNSISSFEDSVAKKLIQLNTFRKMFSDGGKNVSASSERALALSIIAINYFLDAGRFSADKTSEEMSDDLFFKKVGDLEFLDKVLVMGLQDNYDLTNFMCGRSRGGDRATGYLSAYNLNSYNSSPNYGSNSVRIDDIAIQMIEKTDYMI